MSNKEVACTLGDDKQEQRKPLGCMNGILLIFDHRFLLGQRRQGHNHRRLIPGQSNNGEKELRYDKKKSPKVVSKEKNKVSIELPINSYSSSSSSTPISSLDCSRRAQTELSSSCQSVISEHSSSPLFHRKQPDLFMQSPDIRDVVKDSMTREPRVVSIKTVAKDERVSPTMKHVDSPRPFSPLKPIQYDRIDRHLRELKETTRFSCDGRETRYQLKSNMKIKEVPRLSLDSRQGYISNSANDPTSNKRPSSGVVARLMGLEGLTLTLTPSSDESKTSKTNSCLNEALKYECTSVSTKVHKPKRAVKVSHVLTRIPLETAPWKQEGRGWGPQKPPFKSKEGPPRAEPGSRSIYDEIEKRLTEHEFKTTGKDLRVLKQILEAMQKTKKRSQSNELALDNSRVDNMLNQKVDQQDLVGRNRLKDPKVRNRRKATTSNFPECSGTVSPKMQRSKNSMNKPSTDLSRLKKQPGMQRAPLSSKNRNPKAKSMDPLQDSSEKRNLSPQSDSVSFKSEIDSVVTSTKWGQEVNSSFQPKENHRSNIAEWLSEEKSTVDHPKHTMEQPSPVSVLDAFYIEDTPSPVKKKTTAFNDDKKLQFKEAQDQARMNNLPNSRKQDQYSVFSKMKPEKIKNLVHQYELLNTDTDDATVNHTVTSPCEGEIGDHRYVEEIILASGCLSDLDRTAKTVQLHPTVGFINPELYHVLEKSKTCIELTDNRYKKVLMISRLRRKLVFDTVNDVLGHKLAMVGPLGAHKGRILNGDKLLKELCTGIDSLQNKSEIGASDKDDEVINIINADVDKRSQDWDEYCYQVPGLVLDIERLIFKDLICELVNGQAPSLQDWQVKPHCRRLFPM